MLASSAQNEGRPARVQLLDKQPNNKAVETAGPWKRCHGDSRMGSDNRSHHPTSHIISTRQERKDRQSDDLIVPYRSAASAYARTYSLSLQIWPKYLEGSKAPK